MVYDGYKLYDGKRDGQYICKATTVLEDAITIYCSDSEMARVIQTEVNHNIHDWHCNIIDQHDTTKTLTGSLVSCVYQPEQEHNGEYIKQYLQSFDMLGE